MIIDSLKSIDLKIWFYQKVQNLKEILFVKAREKCAAIGYYPEAICFFSFAIIPAWENQSICLHTPNRYLPRFFDQVGHQTTYAYIGNKQFFTKSCHRQTYQNYEQSRQKLGTFLENKVL